MSILSLRSLPSNAIDFEDRLYCLSPLTDISPSQATSQSIRRFGILHPPLVKEYGKRYIIVSGRKRLLAGIAASNDTTFPCLVIPEKTKEELVFELLLEHAQLSGPLSPIEQALFFKKLLVHLEEAKAVRFLPAMGYKPQAYHIKKLLKLLKLEPRVRETLHTGLLSLKTAHKMAALLATDQNELIRIIAELHLGGSKQKKLVSLATELILRTGKDLVEIIAETMPDFRQNIQKNIPQQSTQLLQSLADQCYPRLRNAENTFRRFLQNLHLPSSVQLSHTPAFEDDKLTLSLTFADKTIFEREWNKIRRNLLFEKNEES